MLCTQCTGIENVFNEQMAQRQLAEYRRKGADGGTRLLVDALRASGVSGLSLLDIGGGVGVIQHELFKAGISGAMDVDASTAYLKAAQSETEVQGNTAATQFRHGNFVDIADQIEPADIVTLDRVICCYPDMQALVRLSAARARLLYAVVFPRDGRLMQAAVWAANLFLRISGNPFRTFIHPTAEIEDILKANGFERRYYRISGLVWQVIVYARA